METPFIIGLISASLTLETFLVEWKHAVEQGALPLADVLETFLVEWKLDDIRRLVQRPRALKPS